MDGTQERGDAVSDRVLVVLFSAVGIGVVTAVAACLYEGWYRPRRWASINREAKRREEALAREYARIFRKR